MRNSGQTARRTASNLLLLATYFFLTPALPAQRNQQASPPKYDLHAETNLKGIVEELRLPTKGKEKEIAHLLVKNGTEVVDVYLCPKSFFDDMGMGFSKGDQLSFTGSKVKQDGVDLILAREIVKGNDTFVLRDDKGIPVWK